MSVNDGNKSSYIIKWLIFTLFLILFLFLTQQLGWSTFYSIKTFKPQVPKFFFFFFQTNIAKGVSGLKFVNLQI